MHKQAAKLLQLPAPHRLISSRPRHPRRPVRHIVSLPGSFSPQVNTLVSLGLGRRGLATPCNALLILALTSDSRSRPPFLLSASAGPSPSLQQVTPNQLPSCIWTLPSPPWLVPSVPLGSLSALT